MKRILLLSFFILVSCAPATQPPSASEAVAVYATSAAGPWQQDLFVCADQLSVVLNITPNEPDIYLRVGEPDILVSPAYQIDEEEILIVTHRQSPLQNLSLEQAQALFAGQGDPSIQVWVYSTGEDVQIAFDQLVMKGRIVTSFARLAVSPQQMSDILSAEMNSVGVLPQHWSTDAIRVVYSAGTIPVLAITKAEPRGAVQELLACLQK